MIKKNLVMDSLYRKQIPSNLDFYSAVVAIF